MYIPRLEGVDYWNAELPPRYVNDYIMLTDKYNSYDFHLITAILSADKREATGAGKLGRGKEHSA
jgi:hypothetical protein